MGCTSRTLTIAWRNEPPTGSACGGNTYYQAYPSGENVPPAGQNRLRARIANFITNHDLQVDVYSSTIGEHCFHWLANTGFDVNFDSNPGDTFVQFAFRDGGNNPTQLLGLEMLLDWSNLPTQSDCSGAGIPVAPPVLAPPPSGFLPAPTFNCTTIADICAVLTSMQAKLEVVRGYTQLLQRWGKPFGYITGATYANLEGEGFTPISRLLGMSLYVVARPEGGFFLPGNPPYLWDMGWVTINDANGMLAQLRITRDGDTWFPEQMPLATSFNWFLQPGVKLTAIETRVEP